MSFKAVVECKVTDFLSQPELLAGLAEEAAELAAAALKMRRVYGDTNPTPVGYMQAKHDLEEEIADVFNYLGEIHIFEDRNVNRIMEEKHDRWLNRLIEARKKEDGRLAHIELQGGRSRGIHP